MIKYTGSFKDSNDDIITVDLIPNGEITNEKEITLPFEEPVIINCSSDGIFQPIKSTSCTIKLFSEEIYWDLYTPSVTGYTVRIVKHIGNVEQILFVGCLTPCIYTQDYAYKAEIEIEAVDYLGVIKQFDYKVSGDKEIITVQQLINKLFSPITGYNSFINETKIDFTKYNVQESNFFDDDGEPMNNQEILDELLKYLGCSAQMYDGSVVFIDYTKERNTTENLSIRKYGEGTPTVELDDVYNKISIGCDLYEIDDLTDEIVDKDNKTIVNEMKLATNGNQLYSNMYFSWREHNHHTTDKHRYTMLIKPYTFVDAELANNKEYVKGRWNTYNYRLSDYQLEDVTITEKSYKDTSLYKDSNGNNLFVPYYFGAYPIRIYSYNKAEGMENKNKINWLDYIAFPAKNWETRNNTLTPQKALSFKSDENIAYSVKDGTGYLLFNADLWVQSDIGIKGVDTDVIWGSALTRDGVSTTVPICVPMENMDLSFDEDVQRIDTRNNTYPDYNKGWGLIKASLKIGNKWWNGTAWTTTESTFTLNYHDDEVSGGDKETLHYFVWLKTAPNPDVPKVNVGNDGYAIPITAEDKLNGKLEFTLYTPFDTVTKYDILTHRYETIRLRTTNTYFLKDLSMKYVFKDSTNWADDAKVENDIVYENIINEDYAVDMEEMDLKINSWYQDKPISKSYFLDENKLPVVKINNEIQEVRLLEYYYNHYSTPKKRFNINYKTTDMNPINKYYHSQTNTTYIQSGYNMNVKTSETNINLIEL